MEKQFIFIPHKIEGEESLPKVKGRYFVNLTKYDFYKVKFNPTEKYHIDFMKQCTIWLEEVPVPTDEEIEKEAEELSCRFDNISSNATRELITGINMVNWFKSKLKLK